MPNNVHPTAVIEGDVQIGEGNVIGPYAVLVGPSVIGDDNWIGPHATIGFPAQIRRGASERVAPPTRSRGVRIGNRCVIREYASVHQGDSRTTEVRDDCYLMTGSNVPHDALLGDGCTLSAGVQLGGHTVLEPGVTLGMNAVVHQFCTVGTLAMVGMQAAVVRDVLPFALVSGVPAVVRGANRVAMQRRGHSADVIEAVDAHLRNGSALSADLPAEVGAAFAGFARRSRRP